MAGENEAVTDVAAFMVTVQVPIPEQPPPDHPEKLDPLAGEAARVTDVPAGKLALAEGHAVPQLIPVGKEITDPLPEPDFDTVSTWVAGENEAVTDVGAFIVTVQAPAPEQPPPDHPMKVDPLAAEAVSVTDVPVAKVVLAVGHEVPQLMPAGEEVTVPLPDPDFETISG